MFKKSFLFLLASCSAAFSQTAEIDALVKQRAEAVAKIDAAYKAELEKLKYKYMKEERFEAAATASKMAEVVKVTEKPRLGADKEFENTKWNFNSPKGTLDTLVLLPGGKIESTRYPTATWKVIDNNSIEWRYNQDDANGLVLKFTSDKRDQLSGTWADGKTVRTMVKIPSGTINPSSRPASIAEH